jgi:hypothetical protein
MKVILVALLMSLSSLSFAHDEGHGPKLTDSPKQGGVVAPVVLASEVDKGPKATLVHKAELVRTEDGMVRVYLYDKDMNPLDLKKFDKGAKAILEVEKKKKVTKTPFTLSLDGDSFSGKAPKPSSKPFNIDIRIKEGSKELLTAFDNLD